ncbi:g7511 [Coccomyxa elongata]
MHLLIDEPHNELPVELQGLDISDDGQYLVDRKSGKVLNEFGATRFDVAVRALRGELDPPKSVQNTERTDHLLIGALKQFPLDYTFNIVFKGSQNHDEVTEYLGRILQRVCGTTQHECRLAERLRGKYLSVQATANIKRPDMIAGVFEELDKDTRIVMKY